MVEKLTNGEKKKRINNHIHKHPKDVEGIIDLHNKTQIEWDERYNKTVTDIKNDIHTISEKVEHIDEKVDTKLTEHTKQLKRDFERFQKQKELNDKFQTRFEVKKELDDARDKEIERIKKRQDVSEEEVKAEIVELRKSIEDNRRERREDIKDLSKQITEGFKTAKKERQIENKDIKDENTKSLTTVLYIIVPILVATLGFIFYHAVGR